MKTKMTTTKNTKPQQKSQKDSLVATAAANHSKASNPFFIFLHEFRQNFKESGIQPLNNSEVTKLAGERWRQMSTDDKLSYVVWARKNRNQKESIGGNRKRNRRSRSSAPLRRIRKSRNSIKQRSNRSK